MKRFPIICLALAATTRAIAQTATLSWSATFGMPGSDLIPEVLSVAQNNTSTYQQYVGVAALSGGSPSETGFLVTLSVNGSALVNLTSTQIGIPGFGPVGISSGGADTAVGGFNYVPEMFGKQVGSNGSKVSFLGSDGMAGPFVSGSWSYEYRPSSSSFDQPLGLDSFPYGTYSVSNTQTGIGNARQLSILSTRLNGQDPIVRVSDPAITPAQAVFTGRLMLAAGTDNNALSPGGARASAYVINQDETVSPVFTQTFLNTLSNHVFTSHSLLWGSLSSSFNVLIDNQQTHNANNGTTTRSFVLRAYDGTGALLWTSNSFQGRALQVSLGSQLSIYFLGIYSPSGEFLYSFGKNGVLRWSKSSHAVRMAAALDQGVVAADNNLDSTGHHHAHVTKIAENGSTVWTQTLATGTTNDDFVYELQWITGHIFITGQFVPAVGSRGIFGAQYDQGG